VLDAVPDRFRGRMLVVDNGSSDRTPQVATDHGARVLHEPRRGYGAACLQALAALAAAPPEVVVFLDGDFSDHPEEMDRVVAPIEAGEAELVIGSRVLGAREPGALAPQARFGNALATGLMRAFFGVRFTDLGPFRAVTWAALERVGMEDRDYGWTVELQIKAAKLGIPAVEVPVSYRRRIGESKVTGTVTGTVRAGHKILWWIFKEAVRR
jgi:glycosyltransferase involved in cell wall biosynthesis